MNEGIGKWNNHIFKRSSVDLKFLVVRLGMLSEIYFIKMKRTESVFVLTDVDNSDAIREVV